MSFYFLFSNSGGRLINSEFEELRFKGITRDKMKAYHFDKLLNSKLFLDGVYKDSELISHAVINAFVPFLPLEMEHVVMCIKQYLKNQNHVLDAQTESSLIKEVKYFFLMIIVY